MSPDQKETGWGTWYRRKEERDEEREFELELLEAKAKLAKAEANAIVEAAKTTANAEIEKIQANSAATLKNRAILIGAAFLILVTMILGSIAGANSYFKYDSTGIEINTSEQPK